MRVYSYLYHFALALFLLGVSGLVLATGAKLRMPMLPWTGDELVNWLLWGSIAGLISVVLAVTGWFKYLFPIWALIVLVMMVRGYLLGPYAFAGRNEFYMVLLLIFGGLLAFVGSLMVFRTRARRV